MSRREGSRLLWNLIVEEGALPYKNARMKSHRVQLNLIATAVLPALAFAPLVLAAGKPKYTIKEVMKEIHKGDDNIGKRAVKGQASKDDISKMVEYYTSLPLNDPPRGDKESWLAKTSALVKAGEELKAGAPNAVEHYKQAANCKVCHEAHKPPQEKEKK
jgi:cytochrome c553